MTPARHCRQARSPGGGWAVDRQAAGLLPGAGGGSVAMQDLRLVLVPGGGSAVRVDDQGPAPAVDHHLMGERTQEHAVLMGTWQVTADAVQGCEPLVKTAGLPAGFMPASSLAGDAFVETGRIWRVQAGAGDP